MKRFVAHQQRRGLSFLNIDWADKGEGGLATTKKANTMSNVHAVDRPQTVQDHLAKARRAANIGDSSHTIFHAQEAVCLALAALGDEIAALRRELSGRNARS